MRSGHYRSVKCLFVAPGSELTTNIYNCVFTLCTEDKWIGTHKLLTRTKKNHTSLSTSTFTASFFLYICTPKHTMSEWLVAHFTVYSTSVSFLKASVACKPSLGGKFCQGGSKKVLFNAETNINREKILSLKWVSYPHPTKLNLISTLDSINC